MRIQEVSSHEWAFALRANRRQNATRPFPCHPSPNAEDLILLFLFVIPEGNLLLPYLSVIPAGIRFCL